MLELHKVTLDASSRRHTDVNGFLEVNRNPIAKAGVFEYAGSEMNASDPSKIYKVYRPFNELVKAKDLFKGKPILFGHEWVGTEDTPHICGSVAGNIGEEKPYLYADLVIYDQKLINAIESGEIVELSPGYLARYDKEEGEYKGEAYEYVQRDLKFNHLAVVENGRSGGDLKVLDSNNAGVKTMAVKTKDEDKRKVMSEIEGMLKGKVDEELWRTVVEKLEAISYEPSETAKAGDETPEKVAKEEKEPTKGETTGKEPVKDEGVVEELSAALNALKEKFDAFLQQEAKEPAHQEDEEAGEKEEGKTMDKKQVTKTLDATAIKAEIEKNHARVMDAYGKVKPYTGEFNIYANDKLMSEDEVYDYGLRCANGGKAIKVQDAKSAFLAYVEAKSGNSSIQVADAVPETAEVIKLTANIH